MAIKFRRVIAGDWRYRDAPYDAQFAGVFVSGRCVDGDPFDHFDPVFKWLEENVVTRDGRRLYDALVDRQMEVRILRTDHAMGFLLFWC